MTPLGSHLLDLPLDPVYGKILLHGVLLKCLDPVLTIACTLAYRWGEGSAVSRAVVCRLIPRA